LEDEEIIALFHARSERAITELAGKYGAICGRLAQNILKDPLDAEECVNDAYLGVWNTVPPQRPDPLLTYVCRIVRNQAVMRYHANTAAKRNSAYDAALEELEGCLASPVTVEGEGTAQELSRLLDGFLDTLDRENRVMFLRRYWYADSIADIAAGSRMSNNSVSARLGRMRTKLKKYLKREGYGA